MTVMSFPVSWLVKSSVWWVLRYQILQQPVVGECTTYVASTDRGMNLMLPLCWGTSNCTNHDGRRKMSFTKPSRWRNVIYNCRESWKVSKRSTCEEKFGYKVPDTCSRNRLSNISKWLYQQHPIQWFTVALMHSWVSLFTLPHLHSLSVFTIPTFPSFLPASSTTLTAKGLVCTCLPFDLFRHKMKSVTLFHTWED